MKKILNILGLATVLALCGTQSASAISLVFSPQNQTVNLFSQASVDIMVTDLLGLKVGSYDFFVGWNSSILSLNSVTYGNANFDGDLGVIRGESVIAPGSEEVFGFTLGDLLNQDGSTPIDLMTFTFNTLTTGTSLLTFADGIVSGFDSSGNPIYNGSLGDDSPQTLAIPNVNKVQGSITVVNQGGGHPVPEPTIMLLFGAGFMGWVVNRGRGGKALI